MSPFTDTFELAAQPDSLAPFRKKLRTRLEQACFDDKTVHNVLLSVDEVLTNVIRHAYGEGNEKGKDKMQVSFSEFDDRVEILVEDKGPHFDPLKVPLPKLPSDKPGGLGIYLVRSFMDEVNYEIIQPKGNRLRLVKYKKEKGKDTKR